LPVTVRPRSRRAVRDQRLFAHSSPSLRRPSPAVPRITDPPKILRSTSSHRERCVETETAQISRHFCDATETASLMSVPIPRTRSRDIFKGAPPLQWAECRSPTNACESILSTPNASPALPVAFATLLPLVWKPLLSSSRERSESPTRRCASSVRLSRR